MHIFPSVIIFHLSRSIKQENQNRFKGQTVYKLRNQVSLVLRVLLRQGLVQLRVCLSDDLEPGLSRTEKVLFGRSIRVVVKIGANLKKKNLIFLFHYMMLTANPWRYESLFTKMNCLFLRKFFLHFCQQI